MTRNKAMAALSGIAVLALAACGSASTSQPLAKTAATQSARPPTSESGRPTPANTVPANTVPASRAPTNERRAVPAGTTTVTISLKPGMNTHVKPPQPASVSDPAKVRQLTALVNGLPLFPAGAYACPFDDASSLTLTFNADKGHPRLAVATVRLEGCEGVDLTVNGREQPGLGTPDGGRGTASQALKIAGLHWDLARYIYSLP
jgi:hypothetical protein